MCMGRSSAGKHRLGSGHCRSMYLGHAAAAAAAALRQCLAAHHAGWHDADLQVLSTIWVQYSGLVALLGLMGCSGTEWCLRLGCRAKNRARSLLNAQLDLPWWAFSLSWTGDELQCRWRQHT